MPIEKIIALRKRIAGYERVSRIQSKDEFFVCLSIDLPFLREIVDLALECKLTPLGMQGMFIDTLFEEQKPIKKQMVMKDEDYLSYVWEGDE